MGIDSDGRWRSSAMTTLALAVLIAGGWWWVANEPTVTGRLVDRSPALGGGSATRPGAASSDAGGPAGRSGDVVIVDPATGRIVGEPGSRRRVGPEDTIVFRVPADSTLAAGPVVTVWQERAWLGDDTAALVRRTGADSGARFLFQYSCRGEGALRVEVDNADVIRAPAVLDCPDELETWELTATGGPVAIRVTNATGQPVGVVAQLLRLS